MTDSIQVSYNYNKPYVTLSPTKGNNRAWIRQACLPVGRLTMTGSIQVSYSYNKLYVVLYSCGFGMVKYT
jgi:hypothetical protein